MPESQCGFRSKRGTIDPILVLRQIQEKCREQNIGLYAAVVDLTKASDTISRDELWKIMARLGGPRKFLTILRQLREGQQGQLKHNMSLSPMASSMVRPGPHIVLHLPQHYAL